MTPDPTPLTRWLAGVPAEAAFWRQWFATRGGEWPEDFAERLKAREIAPHLLAGFDDPAGVRILDVGSGPMTSVGSLHDGAPLDVTACDPLAPIYSRFVALHALAPPVATVFAPAEHLSAFFEPGSFDLTTCSNALDHSFDPVLGLEEMLLVTRIGGRVRLDHHRNEAERGDYHGLHQWNFDADDGDFVIWNRESRTNVTQRVADIADVWVDATGDWITVTLTKTAHPHIDFAQRSRSQLRALLEALVTEAGAPVASGEAEDQSS